ncbi:MAG TPA: hypothetical protein VKM55_19600 [Candidatus Lokiarchaeia archaeon]|nr:hypothetical protein [Candidatus Lokiarchaeia archaeon]
METTSNDSEKIAQLPPGIEVATTAFQPQGTTIFPPRPRCDAYRVISVVAFHLRPGRHGGCHAPDRRSPVARVASLLLFIAVYATNNHRAKFHFAGAMPAPVNRNATLLADFRSSSLDQGIAFPARPQPWTRVPGTSPPLPCPPHGGARGGYIGLLIRIGPWHAPQGLSLATTAINTSTAIKTKCPRKR